MAFVPGHQSLGSHDRLEFGSCFPNIHIPPYHKMNKIIDFDEIKGT